MKRARFVGKQIFMMPGHFRLLSLTLLLLLCVLQAQAQTGAGNLRGMWSDPPHTVEGDFCFAWCTDAGMEYLNKLLDDPANDARPFGQLSAEATKYQRDVYIRSQLTDHGLKNFPLDPADDPAFLRCEPDRKSTRLN